MSKRRSKKNNANLVPLLLLLVLAAFAYFTQALAFFIAITFALLAIALWLIGARKRVQDLQRWRSVSNMFSLSPEDFESHVAQTYALLGYKTQVTPRVADQGIDVLAERGQERLGIQCKRTTEPVSNSAVQEAYAGQAHYKCTGASVVALGGFTSSARSLATSTRVTLLDGAAYANLFHEATAARPSRSIFTVLPQRSTAMRAGTLLLVSALAFILAIFHQGFPTRIIATTGSGESISETPGASIRAFYSEINSHDFASAYQKLSPSFKKTMTLESFARGYATTVSVFASTRGDSDRTVAVALSAVDRTADGSTRTSSYEGHWTVIPSRSGWLLDSGSFRSI